MIYTCTGKTGSVIRNTQNLEILSAFCIFPVFRLQGPFLFYKMNVRRPPPLGQWMSRPNMFLQAESFCIQCRTWMSRFCFIPRCTCRYLYLLILRFILANQKPTFSSHIKQALVYPLFCKIVYTIARYYLFQSCRLHHSIQLHV